LTGVPATQPVPDVAPLASQRSTPLQATESVQKASLPVCTQTSLGASQRPVVQPMPSSQLGGVPAAQPVAVQCSTPLQNLPSSQALSESEVVQPPAASLQESTVQAIPSLHTGGAEVTQPAALAPGALGSQASTPSQTRPSSQLEAEGVCTQASVAASQLSEVHAKPSSQLGAVPRRQPIAGSQVSTPLHMAPSSQSASVRHGGRGIQPSVGSHIRPSLHTLSSGVCEQAPSLALQVSAVQEMKSSQETAVPGAQRPAVQLSVPLQASPSSQSEAVVQPPPSGVAPSFTAPSFMAPSCVAPSFVALSLVAASMGGVLPSLPSGAVPPLAQPAPNDTKTKRRAIRGARKSSFMRSS